MAPRASPLTVLAPAANVRGRALSRDGRFLAELREDGVALVIELATRDVVMRRSCDPQAQAITLSDDGTLVAVLGPRRQAQIVNVGSGRPLALQFYDLRRRRATDQPMCGLVRCVGGNGAINRTSERVGAEHLVIAPDNRAALTIARFESEVEYYYGGGFIDEAGWALLCPFAEPWSPEILFADSGRCEIDYRGGEPDCEHVVRAVFSGSGRWIALLMGDGQVACWDRERRALERGLLWPPGPSKARVFGFALASPRFACVGASQLRHATLPDLQWRIIEDSALAHARAIAIRPDGELAAVALSSGGVARYDLSTSRKIDTLPTTDPLSTLSFDPSGALIGLLGDSAEP